MATTLQRIHLVGLMNWLVTNNRRIFYRQERPMVTRGLTEQQLADAFHNQQNISMDCSESVTLLCRMAGLANPSGTTYASGVGNTQLMYGHLPHYTNPRNAEPGALVFFGPQNDLAHQHVCMMYDHYGNGDVQLFSHGDNDGPAFIALSQERKYHTGDVVFLAVANL